MAAPTSGDGPLAGRYMSTVMKMIYVPPRSTPPPAAEEEGSDSPLTDLTDSSQETLATLMRKVPKQPTKKRTKADSPDINATTPTPGPRAKKPKMWSDTAAAAPTNTKAKGLPIPTNLAEAKPHDLMLWRRRNNGESFADILEEWIQMTGITPGGSTLSNRYSKLKANFTSSDIDSEDFQKMVEIEKRINKKWETTEKWERIAAEFNKETEKSLTHMSIKAAMKRFGVKNGKKNNVDGGIQDEAGDDDGDDHLGDSDVKTPVKSPKKNNKENKSAAQNGAQSGTVNPADLTLTNNEI